MSRIGCEEPSAVYGHCITPGEDALARLLDQPLWSWLLAFAFLAVVVVIVAVRVGLGLPLLDEAD